MAGVVNQLCHLTPKKSLSRYSIFRWRNFWIFMSITFSSDVISSFPLLTQTNIEAPVKSTSKFPIFLFPSQQAFDLFIYLFYVFIFVLFLINERKKLWNEIEALWTSLEVIRLFCCSLFCFMGSMMINTSVALKMFYKAWFPDMQFRVARAWFLVVKLFRESSTQMLTEISCSF